jgi:hypothetical protein
VTELLNALSSELLMRAKDEEQAEFDLFDTLDRLFVGAHADRGPEFENFRGTRIRFTGSSTRTTRRTTTQPPRHWRGTGY